MLVSFLEHTAMRRRQDNSDSWAQEPEGHAFNDSTLARALSRNLDCYWPCHRAINHVIPS